MICLKCEKLVKDKQIQAEKVELSVGKFVLETRESMKGMDEIIDVRRRRRVCPKCGHRFTTYEVHQEDLFRMKEKIDAYNSAKT